MSGARRSVGVLDVAKQLPGFLKDTPTILRGVITGFGARPSAKTSIGKIFQDRAEDKKDNVFREIVEDRRFESAQHGNTRAKHEVASGKMVFVCSESSWRIQLSR